MNTKNGVFTIKLYELERQYGRTMSRLRIYEEEDHGRIRQELKQLMAEYQENEQMLQRNVSMSRSPAVSALAEAQLRYDRRVRHILQEELPGYLHGENSDPAADQAEAASLYGEYAIDFAVQALRHALIAALWAIDLQRDWEEREQPPRREPKPAPAEGGPIRRKSYE